MRLLCGLFPSRIWFYVISLEITYILCSDKLRFVLIFAKSFSNNNIPISIAYIINYL